MNWNFYNKTPSKKIKKKEIKNFQKSKKRNQKLFKTQKKEIKNSKKTQKQIQIDFITHFKKLCMY